MPLPCRVVLGVLVVTFGASGAHPQTLHRRLAVPGQFQSIQAAIDSARTGDTVLVAPGRYYENIRFQGQNIVVASEFILHHDPGLIDRTIIDGSRPRHPDSASVVLIYQFEDSTAVLEGFTLTGGKGTVWYDNKDKVPFREGGGVLVDLAGPTIRNNVIEGNEAILVAPGMLSAGGGGIRVGFADPIIEHNIVRDNRGRYGAGVVLFYAAAQLRNNLIVGNSGGEDFGGAGVWAVGHFSKRLRNVLENNTIVHNTARAHDPASPPPGPGGSAGGLFISNTILTMRKNIVWGNQQSNGAAIGFPRTRPPVLTDNVVEGRFPGRGNTDADPLFADSVVFRLSRKSPALRINAGWRP